MDATKTRLGDLAVTYLWFTSVGSPAGVEISIDEDNDHIEFPRENWADLNGEVIVAGGGRRWHWDGQGRPTDWNSNSVLKISAHVE